MKFLIIYLIIINIIALIVTVRDKLAAMGGKWRVKESTLILIAALGGSPTMYLTMLIIRHKTRKPKFMVGIPLILTVELIVIFLLLNYVFKVL